MVSSIQFAAENVAPDVEVCTRFWQWIFLNLFKNRIGIWLIKTASSAPTTDVSGATPVCVRTCIPTIAPSTLAITAIIKMPGSINFGISLEYSSSSSSELPFSLLSLIVLSFPFCTNYTVSCINIVIIIHIF